MLSFKFAAATTLLAGLFLVPDGVLAIPTDAARRNPAIPVICSSTVDQNCGFENPTLSPWATSSFSGGATFSLVTDEALANSGSNSVVFVGGGTGSNGQAALSQTIFFSSLGFHNVTLYTRLAAGPSCILAGTYGSQRISQGPLGPVSDTYSAQTIGFQATQFNGTLQFVVTCTDPSTGSTIYIDDVSVV